MEKVATIRTIVRYPVKSMAGEELPAVDIGIQGLAGDRRYAFVQAASKTLFPWLTAREHPRLLLYRPRYEDPASQRSRVLVETPSGARWPVHASELLRELEDASGRPLHLLGDHRGSYDIAAVSILGLATAARVAEESDTPVEPARFRANFYVDAGDAFAEERWVGRVLRLGDAARVAVTTPDERCAIVSLDPRTAASSPAVLRAIAQRHGNRVGVYGAVLTPGTVRAGDPVYVE